MAAPDRTILPLDFTSGTLLMVDALVGAPMDTDEHGLRVVVAYLLMAMAVISFMAFMLLVPWGDREPNGLQLYLTGFLPSASVALLAFPAVYLFFTKRGVRLSDTDRALLGAGQPHTLEDTDRSAIYTFAPGSQDEASFFAAWYSSPGQHYVFCNDLDWLTGVGSQIRDALVATASAPGSSVDLFTRNENVSVTQQLAVGGVAQFAVPDHIQAKVRFSIHESEGDTWLIIRDKSLPDTTTRFIKTSNVYMIALAHDLFEACKLAATKA